LFFERVFRNKNSTHLFSLSLSLSFQPHLQNLLFTQIKVANIVVGSIAIAGYWSGGCAGCGYFNYYAGNGYGAGACG